MDFWLEPDDTALNCRIRIENTSAGTVPMYWWSNIAVPEWSGGRIAVPAAEAYTQKGSYIYKTPVPLEDGTDITNYNVIPAAVDYFFNVPEAAPKYIAAVDANGTGLLQLSSARLRGRKLFSWGHTQASARWQAYLTERAGDYVEIQAGLAKTQYGCIPMPPHTAWEWLEQYSAVQIPPDVCRLPHDSFISAVTGEVNARMLADDPTARLRESREMALRPAEPVLTGSGYGALESARRSSDDDRPLPKHLRFPQTDPRLEPWTDWLKGGTFPEAEPEEAPAVFLFGEHYQQRLLSLQPDVLSNNWMAQYQLGLLWYARADYERAEACLARSLSVSPTGWAHHALACVFLQRSDRQRAREHILAGLSFHSDDFCFLRETFVILSRAGFWADIRALWETLSPVRRKDGRIRFIYLMALAETGEAEMAFDLLTQGDGFVPDDVREGEDALSELYIRLYRQINQKEPASLPRAFDFRMQSV
ncbi:MAG: DUF5107 domain-containing protein [Clostridiales bacterium]|nr:DUF5107 domain-containing protein [Clostridiales bacterium]